jgi:hypothetical protein
MFKYKNIKLFNDFEKSTGFSITKLLILVIVIVFLIVGFVITKNSIKSAKVSSAIQEVENLGTAFKTFNYLKKRVAGDFDMDGRTGKFYSPNATTLEPNYKLDSQYAQFSNKIVSHATGPFIDLLIENLWDFEPENSNILSTTAINRKTIGKIVPFFKKIDNTCIGCYANDDATPFWTIVNLSSNSTPLNYALDGYYVQIGVIDREKEIPIDTLEIIDTKIDDGIYNSGELRSWCGTNSLFLSYKDAKKDGRKCSRFLYRVMGIY